MKQLSITFLLLLFSAFSFAENVKLKGTIGGKYGIEMELEKSTDKENPIGGKYNYSGKTAFLTLKGLMYSDNIIYLEEFNSKGKQTGTFYLEWEEGKWKGIWTGNEKHFDVVLEVTSGDYKQFREFDFAKLNKSCNSSITGSYANDYYFLNDMWLHETGAMEVGFNGGVVSVEEVHKDTIKVQFELMCGPTYHVAFFDGYAIKKGKNVYEFNQSLYGDTDACHLIFTFKDKKVSIDQKSSSMDCEFGARAYADGEFQKINNKAKFGETVGIDDVLKMK